MEKIFHHFAVNAPAEKVFDALTSLDGLRHWWTKDTTGNAAKNGELRFGFGGEMFNKMKVAALDKNKGVEWTCIEGNPDWIGTQLSFQLNEDKKNHTVVDFYHDGWKSMNEMFGICNYHWAMFMNSLKSYCENGQGMPHAGKQLIMVDVSVEEVIAVPLEKLVAFASDPLNAPRWYRNIKVAEWITPPPLQPGSAIRFQADFLSKKLEYTYTVIEWINNQKLVMKTSSGPFEMETIYTWSATNGGTKMKLQNKGNPKGFARWFSPFMSMAMRMAMKKDLKKLKQLMEG